MAAPATTTAPIAAAAQRRRRAAGSCASAASSASIDGKRCPGLVPKPRNRIRRIQVGTRVSAGGSAISPLTTLAMSVAGVVPANGRDR